MFKVIFSYLGKEKVILGVGPGPSAFNIMDTQFIQLMRDFDLIADGIRYPLGLGTVS